MRRKTMLIAIGLISLGIFIDQFTKFLAVKYLQPGQSYVAIRNVINITYVENTGGAFGLLSGRIWIFIIITTFALFFFAYLMRDFNLKQNPIFSASMILIFVGTVGNFIDRIFRGFVVDFVQFAFWRSFAVFNFADMCISVGVAFIIGDILFGKGTYL